MSLQLFVVGIVPLDAAPGVWEFVGVFDDRERAECAATERNYFVAPCLLNESAPDGTAYWPEAYYPKASER